jgi:hypothetical protein
MKNQLLKSTDIAKTTIIMNEPWIIAELKYHVANAIYMKRLIAEYFEDPNCRPSDWIAGEKLTDFEKAVFIYECNRQIRINDISKEMGKILAKNTKNKYWNPSNDTRYMILKDSLEGLMID